MNVDVYLSSMPHDRSLYEADGFEYAEENLNVSSTDNLGDAWKEPEEVLARSHVG